MTKIFVAAIFYILSIAVVISMARAECIPLQPTVERIEAAGAVVVELHGAAKAEFVRDYNDAEPRSEHSPERVFIALNPRGPVSSMAFVTGECIVLTDRLPTLIAMGYVGTPS